MGRVGVLTFLTKISKIWACNSTIVKFFYIAGLVVFANYWSCDPKLTGIITKRDELVTLFVLDHLVDFVGIPGIFIASLLCGALRYVSKCAM